MERVFTSGDVARHAGVPRWKLMYLIERGELPAPNSVVPGRRLFTAAEVETICELVKKRSEARTSKNRK